MYVIHKKIVIAILLISCTNFPEIYPSKPTSRQRPKAVGGASERSERRRSALFKNPLFFSGKFLGCYIQAAQNFFRYIQFSNRIGHKKITLLIFFSGKFLGCYIEAAQNFIRDVQFLSQIGHKNIPWLNWY